MSHRAKGAKASVRFKRKTRKSPHNSAQPTPKRSVQLGPSKKTSTLLLTGSRKRRGPKRHMRPSEVFNRAYDLQLKLKLSEQEIDWDKLVGAKTKADLDEAFKRVPESYRRAFLVRRSLVVKCVQDPKFPKRDRQARIRFLGESLGSDGRTSLRRSRDICLEERRKEKKQGIIVRQEFYIECTCGYKGPARNGGCPQCGSKSLSPSVQFPFLTEFL